MSNYELLSIAPTYSSLKAIVDVAEVVKSLAKDHFS